MDPIIHNGKNITDLANAMFDEYAKYPTTTFPGRSLHDKIESRAKAAIQAAKDISDISGI